MQKQHTTSALESAFYIGKVFHKRFVPKVHAFTYPLYMNFINLDEVETLNDRYWWFSSRRWAPLQLKTSDYLKHHPSHKDGVKDHDGSQLKQLALATAKELGAKLTDIDKVCVLAQLRCFGIYFSPVNFFFLYANNKPVYLIAEVSNTPWNNTHSYLVDLKDPKATEKAFHVSPFMDLDMEYRWRVKAPESDTHITIDNWRDQQVFTATFSAKRYAINSKKLSAIFLRWPIVTLSIVRAIYWQALKLFLKGIRYVPYQTKTIDVPAPIAEQSNIKSKP